MFKAVLGFLCVTFLFPTVATAADLEVDAGSNVPIKPASPADHGPLQPRLQAL